MFYPMTLKNLEIGDQVNKLDKLMIDPCVNLLSILLFKIFIMFVITEVSVAGTRYDGTESNEKSAIHSCLSA